MNKLSVNTIIIVLILSGKTMAYTPSEGDVSAYFGPFVYKTNYSGSDTGANAPVQTGVGLIVNGDINKKGSLEIGMLFYDKIYFREDQGKVLAEQTRTAHISMGYRRWWGDYFSTSLSFYSAYSLGDPEILHNDFPTANDVDTSARDTTEYGFDLAVQTDLWSNEKLAVVADARYSFSVTNKTSEKGDHYGVLIGVRYQLQDKKPSDNLEKTE